MIELDSLKFTVDTAELVNAVTKVQDLQKAVTQLNKPLVENAKISAKVAAENAKVAVAEEKVAQAKAKTAEAENKANAAKARAEKATDNLIKKNKEQTSVLERQQSIYEFMTAGYSKGQATVLAQAKAQGALADEIDKVGKVLADQRKLIGGDPFDKSVSGLTSLRNAMVELRDEQRTYTAGVQMTSKQYKEFARDKLRIIEVAKAEGATLSELKQRLRDHGAEYVRLTNEVNRLTEAEKARERAQRDQLNASRSIAAEDEKMVSIVATYNQSQNDGISIHDRVARSIAVYERNLRVAGVSAEVAAAKLATYRKNVMMVQEAEQKRRVEMLSRALAPQISDVVVSLASGMNPFTVMLQQGLQVRDLIGQSQVEASKLGESFRGAGKDIVTSLKGTAVALSSMLVGAIQDAGFAFYKFSKNISGDQSLQEYRNRLLALNGLMGETPKEIRLLDSMIRVLGITGAFAITSIVVSLAILAKGFFEVIKQENDLARALALTGKSLGMSHQQAITLAESMENLGINTSDAMKTLTLMAKEGVFTAKEVQNVTKAATDLEKYGGVAIEDTVKSFAKLKEKPVEALIELAKKTEGISAASINAVNELNKQGKAHEASSLAIKIQADVVQTQTARMKNDLSSLTLFAIELAKGIASVTDEIFNSIFRRTPDVDLAKKLQQELNIVGKDSIRGKEIERQLVSLRRQSESRAVAADLTNQQNAAQNALNNALSRAIGLEETLKTNAAKRTEEIAKANKDYDLLIAKGLRTEQDRAKAIAAINEKYKDADKPKTDPEKELDKIRKGQVRDIERLNDLLEENKQKRENLTEAERIYIDIMSSEDWAKKTPLQKQEIENLVEKAKAEELAARALKQRLEIEKNILNSYIEVWRTRDDLMFDIMEESDKLTQSIDDQTQELQLQLSVIGLIGEEKSKAIKLKKLEIQYEKELRRAREISDPSARKEIEDAALRRYQQAKKNLETESAIESANKSLEKYSNAFEDLFSKMGDAIVDFAMTGERSFGDLIKSMIADLLKFELQLQTSNLFKGIGGFAGIATSMGFGNTSMAVAAASTMPGNSMDNLMNLTGAFGTTQANGGAWMNGIQEFAQGGTFTNSIVSSPTLFKFAKGTGLMGEAGPEAIMPLTRGSDGSLGVRAEGAGSNVQVIINNSSGAQASASETVDSKGNRRIEVTIGEMAAAEISKSGSTSQNNIRSTFGLQPRLARR